MPTALVLLAAVAAGWLVQLLLTYRQSMAFQADVRRLRARGTVSIGAGGRRYRGGRAFVAVAVDEHDVVRDAIVLSGITTFAAAKPLPELFDRPLRHLAGDRPLSGLTAPQREAARQAAVLLRQSRERRAEAAVPATT